MYKLISAQALTMLMLPKTDALNLEHIKNSSVCGKLISLAQQGEETLPADQQQLEQQVIEAFQQFEQDENGEISIKDLC